MWRRIITSSVSFYYNRARISTSAVANMRIVSIKVTPDEERMLISFNYGLEGKKQREFNLWRKKDEELSATLERMKASLSSKLIKKKKKKDMDIKGDSDYQLNSFSIWLRDGNESVVPPDTQNIEAWKSGAVLDISGTKIPIEINPPFVKKLTLPQCVMVGYAVYPYIDADFFDMKKSKFSWYKENLNSSPIEMETEGSEKSQLAKRKRKELHSSVTWEKIGDESVYTPENSVIGCKLKLILTPSNGNVYGYDSECVSEVQVNAGPEFCPFEARHTFTQDVTDENSCRVVSYNLLADVYTDSDYSRNVLFPYCPNHNLSMDYRKHLLMKELQGYNADLICLQEVDRKIFINDLQPLFERKGFDSVIKLKAGDVREGMATFFRSSKLRLIEDHRIHMTDTVKNDHPELWSKIETKESMKTKLEDRTSILQVSVLESKTDPNKCLIIGNTHLFFHPRAGNVRVIQSYVCLQHLAKLKEMYTSQGREATVLFCGDLNSPPRTGAIQLIEKGSLPSNDAEWYSGGTEELFEGIPELTHSLNLRSACGYPEYTNFVTSFYACIDYIFVESDKVEVTQVVPLPEHEQIIAFTALPNPVFPSDHLALVCDLKLL